MLLSYLGCWYFKVDIAHAYYNFRIHKNYRSKVGVCWNGKWFVFNVWPFGISSIPLEFTLIMRELEKFFYINGIIAISILDDWLFIFSSKEEAIKAKEFVYSIFSQLGLLINHKKCDGPNQIIEWNGHKFNSINGTISIHDKIIDKIKSELKWFHGTCKVSLKYAQKLSGVLQCCHYVSKSVFSFVSEISGQIVDNQSNNNNNGVLINFNKLKYLSNLIIQPSKWNKVNNIMIVYSDASEYDLGGCFINNTGWNFKFSQIGLNFHINDKELVAAIISLEISWKFGSQRSLVFVDNTAVESWLRKHSNVKNRWRSFIIENWMFWWDLHGFTYDVAWIPSESNPADEWTRL